MSVHVPNLNTAALNTNSAGGAASTGKTAQLDAIKISSSPASSTKSSEKTDEVQLSSLSNTINELQSGSPQRDAYIESLRTEVAGGTYQADAAATSKGLVDDLLRPNR